MDAVEACQLSSLHEAKELFSKAAERLLDVNNWGKISRTSDFKLFSNRGKQLYRPVQEGDYIRIDIPGPGPSEGSGFDWVKVEKISTLDNEDYELLSMCVRPAINPLTNGEKTAHFLQAEATSTFLIRRAGLIVYAEEHGRNELPSLKAASIMDKGRNLVVGLAAKLGLSYPQWKFLVKAFLK